MTNRELLELAARAAGHESRWYVAPVGQLFQIKRMDLWEFWNPNTVDGDALCLAVDLELCVTPYPIFASPRHSVMCTRRFSSPDEALIEVVEIYGDDPYAATRRAIVRAAAEIGKTIS